jgi:hypothetical protein
MIEINDRWSVKQMRQIGEALLKSGRSREEIALAGATTEVPDTSESAQQASGAMFMVLYDWAKCGFPLLQCVPKLGESFMQTRVPADCLPELSAPWPTMVIQLPSNALRAHDLTPGNGWEVPEYIDWVILKNSPSEDPRHLELGVQSTHCNWNLWPVTAAIGLGGVLRIRSVAEMAEMTESLEARPGDIFGNPRLVELDGRDADMKLDAQASTARMMLRFVLGCLLEMSDTAVAESFRKQKQKGPPVADRGREPKSWVFRLSRDVKIDCREWVRGASERGDKRMMTIQSLVRGHWKPKLSEKLGRPVHIEPYWRGPEDAPIAVRSHILAKEKTT